MKNFENTIEIKIDFQELFDDVLSEAKQRDFILMNSDSLTDEDVVRIFKSRLLTPTRFTPSSRWAMRFWQVAWVMVLLGTTNI